MTFLVTGDAGFLIGSAVVVILLSSTQFNVVNLEINSPMQGNLESNSKQDFVR